MHHRKWIGLAALAALAACGGTMSSGSSGPLQNAFTGTITVTSALPAGTTTCGTTQTVTFTAGGANVHSVSVPGGGCVTFMNSDTADHWPATQASNPCAAANAPAQLHSGQSFTTQPLGAATGMQTCDWEDLLNPPTSGGGGY
jgi:hypothetical protein